MVSKQDHDRLFVRPISVSMWFKHVRPVNWPKFQLNCNGALVSFKQAALEIFYYKIPALHAFLFPDEVTLTSNSKYTCSLTWLTVRCSCGSFNEIKEMFSKTSTHLRLEQNGGFFQASYSSSISIFFFSLKLSPQPGDTFSLTNQQFEMCKTL